MPVVVASASRSANALIGYALEDKPNQQGERYVMASGVGGLLVSVAKQQMRDTRKKWGKDKPGAFVHAYHVIESFARDELDPDDPDSWMTAQKLGRALAEDRFPGRQVLIVTQRDGKTGCVHNHLVANSIDTKTGKSLNSSTVMHARLVEAHERVLDAEGFEQRADLKQAFSDATERRERGEPSGLRRANSIQQSELREFQRHILWETECDIADDMGLPRNKEPFSLTVLKDSIEIALTDPDSTDWDSFVEAGRLHGVHIEQRGKKGQGISYGMLREQPDGTLAEPTPSDRRRCSTLGTAFEMEAVEQALARNLAAQQAQTFARDSNVPAPHLPTTPSTQSEPTQHGASSIEGLSAVLDEVHEQANANTRRMIDEYLAAKAARARPQEPDENTDELKQSSSVPVQNDVPLSDLRNTEGALTDAVATSESQDDPAHIDGQPEAPVRETDGQMTEKNHNRVQSSEPPTVSIEQRDEDQAKALRMRKFRLMHPELRDETELNDETATQERGLGD